MKVLVVLCACSLLLSACGTYTLVRPDAVSVSQQTMKVRPSFAWNRAPKSIPEIDREENWTQNGLLLEAITFIGALENGAELVRPRFAGKRQVPVFRSDMTTQELVEMVELYYRIRGNATDFASVAVRPATFLGRAAIELDFSYVGGDAVKHRGRSLIAVADGRLYLVSLDGAALHYFDAALPEFERIAASATISWLAGDGKRGEGTPHCGGGKGFGARPGEPLQGARAGAKGRYETVRKVLDSLGVKLKVAA